MESNKRELKELNPRVIRKTARLVVRNLPFNCNEEDVRKYFSTFGQVVEVKLLRKNDGRLVGCGFVQYEDKFSAANALQHTSGELFKGRPIIVDWAVPKHKYHILKCVDSDVVESKELDVRNKSDKCIVKEEIKEENIPADSKSNRKRKPSENKKTNNLRSHADDDRTVFFKNVPFIVDNEQLKECAEKYAGAVEYAVICMDPLTEHSKGTAFVRFIKKEVAEKVLNNELKLVLHGKELYPHELLKKEELLDRNSKGKISKDKRNLYLFKEGLILAGTAAARSVSQGDMNKRLILERQRSRSLRNLHKFLSTNRLVIYNLPFYNFDNKKLLLLFKKYCSKKAVISEARVMRNLKDLDDNGLPRSKGYGFVSFKRHEDALSALRALNNNPDVFSDKK
uniref:RRM domain-containing protein n=3 Tax=Rhodnius TaxID=13248 RepID=T1H9E0_RHOPR